jgi:plasmid stabilization system protein ParE
MQVTFLSPAADELQEACAWYEQAQKGLGNQLLEEIRAAIDQIVKHPGLWPVLSPRTRKYRLHRFPYGIVYQVGDKEILIVAFMHLHRKPEYWRNRTR